MLNGESSKKVFDDLGSSAGRGSPPPAVLGVIHPSRSHSEKYGFGLSSEMVVSDGG